MCMCTCVCMYVCAQREHVCMCMQSTTVSFTCHSSRSIRPAVLSQGVSFAWSSLTGLGWLASKPQRTSCLCPPPRIRITSSCYHTSLFTWVLGISDPRACVASLLLTDPSLTTLNYNWKRKRNDTKIPFLLGSVSTGQSYDEDPADATTMYGGPKNTHSRLRQLSARQEETLCQQGSHSSQLEKQPRFSFSYFLSFNMF